MVGVLVAALLPAGAPTAAAPAGGCAVVEAGETGTWTRRPVPGFPAGPVRIQSHAVNPVHPTHQVVTNGVSVLASDDGCRWSETLRLDDLPTARMPAGARTDRILEVVWHPRDHRRLWAVVAVGQGVAERLDAGVPLTPAADERRDPAEALLLHSEDAGLSWTAGGLVPGTPGRLALAPSSPARLHLPTSAGLYRSGDAGASWQPLPAALLLPSGGRRPLDGVHGAVLGEVAVHPRDPDHIFGRTSIPVQSRDGGLTWTAYDVPTGYTGGPLVAQQGPEPRPVFTRHEFSTSPMAQLLLDDAGHVLRPVALPGGRVGGALWRGAWDATGDRALVSTWDRGNAAAFPRVSLYQVRPDGSARDVNDLELPAVRGVVADAHGGFHLHTPSELVSLSPRGSSVLGPGQVDLAPFGDTTPEPPGPARLSLPREIRLQPGHPRRVEVGLSLPRRPSPLDTYFLIDTSNSFEPDIAAVSEAMADVVRALRRAGVDAHFGVGELGTTDGRRYRRFADVAAPGTELVRGFERLRTGGSRESHLIALHQTATGTGVAGTDGPAVPAGMDPTWRPGSLRTVVLVTDVEYSDVDDPEAPSLATAHAELRADGVRVVGLEVVREGGDDGVPGGYAAVEAADAASTTAPTPARRDLERTASATGSVAPPGGVDCRGNGTTELAPGDPLVCTTTALHVADLSTIGAVLRRVLLSQTDRRAVRLTSSGPAGLTWSAPREGLARKVDVRRDQRLRFAAEVSCRPDQAGRRLPLTVVARVGGATVTTATTAVRCGAAVPAPGAKSERDRAPLPTLSAPGQAPGPAPVAIVPPAVPVPATGAAPGTAPAPAPGTAPAPQAAPGTAPGVATRGEEESQLALASSGGRDEGDAERIAASVPLVAGLMAGAAVIARRRAGLRIAPARNGSRRSTP